MILDNKRREYVNVAAPGSINKNDIKLLLNNIFYALEYAWYLNIYKFLRSKNISQDNIQTKYNLYIHETLPRRLFLVLTNVSRHARARVPVDPVVARGPILARTTCALVDVDLAMGTYGR